MTEKSEGPEVEPREEIAIIGMAGRFPGAADIDRFWDNLVAGIESIRPFTTEELRAAGADEATLADPEYVRAGAPVEDADGFDAPFFGFSKREAELMDPQHRIFLEAAWTALEHSGYDPESLPGVTGLFGGVAPNTYYQNVLSTRPDLLSMMGRYSLLIGSEREYAITRVAFKLNLNGPAISVATACSTSGVALHLACQSVLSGECDMALAGGARVNAPLTAGYLYEPDGILSPDGRCRTFDADAAGTVIGSGVTMVVIKRLSDAVRDGDTIHAIVKGTAVNNDGAHKIGFTAPGVEGQAAVIAEALDMAEVEAGTIDYMEAHGTGTYIGDPIEIAALTRAFRTQTEATGFCAIGSVKSNIGHLAEAAGLAGVIKTVLALKHRQLPPTLNFYRPNPQIDFESSPFVVNDTLRPWANSGTPRRAGVSSFGLGGTNSHMILEEAPIAEPLPSASEHHLLVVSARTESALEQATADLARHLAETDDHLADIAHTLQVGRRHFPHRRSVVASTGPDASAALAGLDRRVVNTSATDGVVPSPVFMFPGGGAQHLRMGQALYASQPVFRGAFDRCAAIAEAHGGGDLRSLVYPSAESVDVALERPASALPALFAVEYALAELWSSLGVIPTAMIGHSLGEYTAACLAGVLTLEDAMALVLVRGKLFETLPAGAMLSVPLPEDEVLGLLGSDLSLAVVNRPDLCIVAGEAAAVDRLHETLSERGVESRQLHISVAAHSHLVEPILDEFLEFARTIDFQPPVIPYISNTTGTWASPEEVVTPEYWARHLRQTVRFVDGLQTILDGSDSVLIEVGPGQTLSGFARQHPARTAARAIVASLPHPTEATSDAVFFLGSLGKLWLAGIDVDFTGMYTGEERRRVPLPTYPFERKRYWIEPGEPTSALHMSESVAATPVDVPTQVPAAVGDLPQSPSGRKDRIVSQLQEILHQLSGLEMGDLDPYATFLELGFDSLFMTQAASAVAANFGIRVSFRQLFEDAPTINALAIHLDERLAPDEVSTPAPPELPAAASSPEHSGPHPNGSAGGAVPTEVVQRLIEQQLEVMRQQLAVLGGRAEEIGSDFVPGVASEVPATAGPAKAEPAETGGVSAESTADIVPAVPTNLPWRPIDRSGEAMEPSQRRHLDDLIGRLNARSPGSKRITQANRARLADPRTVLGFRRAWKEAVYPLVSARSAGSKVWDVDGNEYLDVTMGFGVNLFGHAPPFVMEAVAAQLENGIEIGPMTPLAGEVAELIGEMTGAERIAFCNTGSEAVLAAMRLARTVTGRSKIVTFARDYHGLFDEVLSRGVGAGAGRKSIPIAPGIPAHMSQDLIILDYGDPESLRTIEALAPQLAAVLVEPVQSRHPDFQPVEFLRDLRGLTEVTGVPLVFDEMITGFRSHPGGAQALFGVKADLVTYGKVIGGGFPIGVVAGKSRYMDALDGGHWQYGDDSIPEADVTWFAGTFVRHPVSLAAARAALLHLVQKGPALQAGLNQRTDDLVAELNAFLTAERLPMKIEHFSSFFITNFESHHQTASVFYLHLRDQGIHLVEGRAAFLSTAHSDDDIARLSAAYRTAAKEMRRGGFLPGAIDASPPTDQADGNGKRIPLTGAQQEIWLAAQMGREANCAYNLAGEIHLRGPLDLPALKTAIEGVVERHEALRTVIDPDGQHQRIADAAQIELPLVDLSDQDAVTRDESLSELRALEAETPFDLATLPLLRAKVVRLGAEEHLLLITVHHVICDGWSAGIVYRDLAALYRAERRDESSTLPEPMQLEEYVRWQEERRAGQSWSDDEAFWMSQLGGSLPVTDFPPDRPRPAVKTYAAGRVVLPIAPETIARLQALATEERCTLFTALLAGLECFLQRLNDGPEVALGVSIAGQTQFAGRELVGHCINMLPMRRPVDDETSFRQHLTTTQAAFLDAYDHQNYSYGDIVKALGGRRDPSRTPLVSVTLNMDAQGGDLDFDGVIATVGVGPRRFENFDVFVNLVSGAGDLVSECTFNLDLFDPETMQRRLEEFVQLLEAAADNPEAMVGDLPVLTAAERDLIDGWNETAASYPQDATLHGLIDAQAARTPRAVAMTFRGREVTYEQLLQRANDMSVRLAELGVGPGSLVGVLMERSDDLIVALYAVLKAGGAYVPLDPEYPARRLQLLIEETEMTAIVTQQSLLDSVPDTTIPVVAIDGDEPPPARHPIEAAGPDDPAYVLYTSGSTGTPKGVVITHRAICNKLFAMTDAVGLDETDRILHKTPFTFDVSVREVFHTLAVGARLVVAEPGGNRDAAYLVRTIAEEGVTTVEFAPSMLRFVLEEDGLERCVALRRVVVGGEVLTPELVDLFRRRLGVELFNEYGPTEAAVGVTLWRCPEDGPVTVVPIGTPLANSKIRILDTRSQPVPIGAPGEIHIGGVQLARGYLHRPELTAERFVADPFDRGARLYKTGDRARWLPDGNIEFLGRSDHQVKVRGYRIELGEIETTLSQHSSVNESVVVVHPDAMDEMQLTAYLTPEDLDESAIRAFLRDRLPRYMIPSTYVVLATMPRTSSGKIDRMALPAPHGSPSASANFVAPRTPLEEQIAGVWAEVLGIPQVGVKDDFFDLGGHSLNAMRANARLRELIGLELSLGFFFEYPTVAEQALKVIEMLASESLSDDELLELVAELASEAPGANPV